MLKWKRTPQQTRRPTVPGVSGEPEEQGKDHWEVTPFPSPKPLNKTMNVELRNGVDSTSTTTETKTTKYLKRPGSNLTRTDSGKSSKSNRSLGTLSAFDPDSAGTLARDTEVTYSMYDGGFTADGDRKSGVTHEGARYSSSFGAVDPMDPQSSSKQGGGISTTRTSRTSTTYRSSGGTDTTSHNGDIEINGNIEAQPSVSKQIKTTTKMTTTKGISASDSKIKDFSTDTKETNASIISTLDNLLVDLDDHDKSFDETMVTASLDRRAVSQRPKNPTKKVGSFSMRSAFDDNPLDKKALSNTSLHDDKFKGELSGKLLNGHQEKTTLSDPDLNTTSNYSSIKRETTTSVSSSSHKFGSGQDITNALDSNIQMSSTSGGGGQLTNGNGIATSEDIGSYNGHDPNLIENEVTTTRNSKTVTSSGGGGVMSSTTAQSAVVSDRSSARRESRESAATSVTRTASQKSDQNNNLSRPTSRATERSEYRSSVARSESGRSPTPPQFKVRDIRGSLSRPSSSLSSGGGDRTSGTFRAYSPNRASYNSSPTREEVSVTSANIVSSSTSRVKRVDSGASASSRQGTEASSKRTSVISTASSAGAGAAAAVGLPDVQESRDRSSGVSTSQRTSVISTTSRSSTITGSRQESPTRAAGSSVSRTSSSTSQGSKLAGNKLRSRPTSEVAGEATGGLSNFKEDKNISSGVSTSQRSSVVNTNSSAVEGEVAGTAAGELSNLQEGGDRPSGVSTSQRTSVISTTSRSSTITGSRQESPTRAAGSSVSRTSSSTSQGSKLAGSKLGSRPTSAVSRGGSSDIGSKRLSAVQVRPVSQISKSEVQGQISRSESQRSKATSETSSSGSTTSSLTSYNFSGQEKTRKQSKGSDTDDKLIDSVDTELEDTLQKSEVTVVEKVSSVYTSGENLKTERVVKEEKRSSGGEALLTSSTSVAEKLESQKSVEGKQSESPKPQASSRAETYDSIVTADDAEKGTYAGYATQSSYGSLTSTDSLDDKSFRKSASNLLEDFKSGRLTSAESTLEKQPATPKGDAAVDEVFTSSSSLTETRTDRTTDRSSSLTEDRSSRVAAARPTNISLKPRPRNTISMGVNSLEKSSTTRDTQYESTARQTHDGGAGSSAASASGSQQALDGEGTPKSPTVKEAQKAITPGLVNKLSKDVFANLNLTGRFIDPSTPRTKSPEPDSDQKEGEEPEKKYKFLIEGIDTPAQEEEVQAEEAAQEKAELSPGIDSLERKPKGFSYVKIDSGLAGEIQKRAATVRSKKPHEAIEEKKASDKIDGSHYESLELKEAKAKLHRQIIQSHQQQSTSTGEEEIGAQSIREARSKLNKQIVEKKITSSREVEESAPSAGVSAEPSHVGGRSQTQTQLQAQLHQQIRERGGQHKHKQGAAGPDGVNGVEPVGRHQLVTPVDDGERGTTVRSTRTVGEERSTSSVPQPPPPPPVIPISPPPPTLSQSSVNKQHAERSNESTTITTSRTTKQNVQVEDIGEDTAEDYKEAKGKHEHSGQPCEIHEEEIVPQHSSLLYDLDHIKAHLDNPGQHAHHHGKLCEVIEEVIVKQHSGLLYDPNRQHSTDEQKSQHRQQKATAKVIEVIEPVVSAAASKRERSANQTGRSVEQQGYSNREAREVTEDNIERRSGNNQQQSRSKIDEAFDLLERDTKHKHNNEHELPPRASTSTAPSGVNNTRTAAGNHPGAGVPRQKPSTTSEGLTDQLSPDSAYQSAAASPIFVTNPKDITSSQQYLRPAQEPIMVQRGEELAPYQAAPVVGQQQYQSKMVMSSTKVSSQSSKQMVNGATVQQAESRELSERQMQYENSGRPNDDGVMITSSRNESMAYRGAGPPQPVRAIGGGPIASNTINHPIQMNGDVTGAQYPSSTTTVDSARIMNSAQTDFNSDVRQHQAQHTRAQPQHGGGRVSGGGYSASSSEGFNTTHRYQDDLHYQPQNRTGVTRKASHLSSSSAGSGQRIVQLRPLTVDVNMANRGGGGTSGPSGMFSPSVKHSQAMYEIQNMTGGSYAQHNGYSPGQLNNVDYPHYSTNGRVYRNHTQPQRKYMKVRDLNSNDFGHRDLEGYQYRRRGRHPYVARVNLEGDPYYSDFEGGSVHSEPMTRLQRRISSRSRQRTLPGTRHWSSSQPSGLHQVPLGDPVHLNIHPQQGHGYGTSPGRLYKARSEGMLVEAAMTGGGGGGEILSPTLTDAHQTRGGNYHITLKLNSLGRGMLDSASTGSYDQGWGTLGDEASNTWDYKSASSWQRGRKDPKASVSLVDIELNDSGVHEPPATRQPTTVTLHSEPRDQQDGSLKHWFRAYHQHHEAMYNPPSPGAAPVVTDPEISTTIPRYNSHPPASPPQGDAAFSMQVNQTMRMDYKPNEQEEAEQKTVPNVVRGSILIKNTIDTTGGARVIDVVETETDGEGEPILDDNTNLFHLNYKQGKENPMYTSNEDLSDMARKQPAFTNIFQQDETDYIEIPVTKGQKKGKPRKGGQRPVDENIRPTRARGNQAPPNRWPEPVAEDMIEPQNSKRNKKDPRKSYPKVTPISMRPRPRPRPDPGSPVNEDIDPRTGRPVNEGIDPRTGRPVNEGIDPRTGRPVNEGIDPRTGRPVNEGIDPRTGRPVNEGIDPRTGRPVNEGIDPRRGGRPERGTRDDPEPVEESISPTRATDRENPYVPQWPSEIPEEENIPVRRTPKVFADPKENQRPKRAPKEFAPNENIDPSRAPNNYEPNQNGWPNDDDEDDNDYPDYLDDFDPQREVPYEQDYPQTSPERQIPIEIEREPEINVPVRREKPRRKPPPRDEGRVGRRSEGQEEQLDITRLLRNAPAGSVKQTINVEREEEEILGPLPLNDAEGEMSDPDGLLNFDTISEKVDLGVLDGKAQLAVKVRCERVVPIRGVEDMFKKSSVIVTRLIQIDMEATEERQRLYRRIMRGSSQQMIEGPDDRFRSRTGVRKLDTKDTFNLYKAFMGVAEAHEGNEREKVKIERRIEDQKQLPEQAEFEFNMAGDDIMGNGYADGGYDDMDYEDGDFDTDELERRLERKMRPVGDSGMRLEEMPGGRGQYMMKNPEPDTISYISQASENHDLLY